MQIQQIYEIIPGICSIISEIFDLLAPLKNNKKSSESSGLYYIRTNQQISMKHMEIFYTIIIYLAKKKKIPLKPGFPRTFTVVFETLFLLAAL